MIHRISLGGVAPGTIIDWSYTVETKDPLIPGDYFTAWRVTPGNQTQRSRFILDLPASVDPRIIEHYLTFARTESVSHGRRVYVWATKDVKKPAAGELFAPDSSYGETITAGSRLSWTDVSKWYASLAKGHYGINPAIQQQVAVVLAGATTRDDTLSKLYRWVAQDFRYVSLSLGIGGYQPHQPSVVFDNKYGDCKDKATFFVAIARTLGYQAFPVLLSAFGGVDTSLASARQFNHMIAAVEKPGGGWQFLDLTAEVVPYGDLPAQYQGAFGLVVRDDGSNAEVFFPEVPIADNLVKTTLAGTMDTAGAFHGRYTAISEGNLQYAMRYAMSSTTKPDSAEFARRTRNVANAILAGSTGDSLELFSGRDLNAVPRYSIVLRGGKLLTQSGNQAVLELPMRDLAQTQVIQTLQASGPRKMPIDARKVSGRAVVEQEVRLTLPAGWRAKLPPNVKAVSVFGDYEATYEQTGRELSIKRRYFGADGVQPASSYDALMAWLKEQAKDDIKLIIIDK